MPARRRPLLALAKANCMFAACTNLVLAYLTVRFRFLNAIYTGLW